jgi:hypothetical protein
MSLSDNSNRSVPDVSIGDAKPYRSPTELSGEAKQRSPLAWLLVGFVIVGFFGSLAVVRYDQEDASNRSDEVTNYVKEFGGIRGGAIEEEDIRQSEDGPSSN